uniref:NADH-ubiquinone oxidoreductase chain 4 n=1 Tax=Calotes versicolor TaxID=48253 RepID=A6P3A3_CALVC|nr:NADH dehydrogenase subunit 4 [Calotes versicolor]BAF69013.1 NADH dehydrogenase subunit 4 [Calotes versicolor]
MLKILIPTAMLIPSSMLIKNKLLILVTTLFSTTLALLSLQWLNNPLLLNNTFSNQHFMLDQVSAPLLVLTTWLLPMMIMASQNHLKTEPLPRKRLFLVNVAVMQLLLYMTLSTNNLVLFFILFESTLIPTLILITRWGAQPKRLEAGNYFMFYTLMGSLPLLTAILLMNNQNSHSYMLMTNDLSYTPTPTTEEIVWTACMVAFLIKLPLYGLHLWLPKAHVEAPIAGSMVLAAVLLKLGGYGIIRISTILPQTYVSMMYPPIIMALWGLIMTSLTCIRQTDLKSLIAYSSVGHMGLVISATMIQTPWSISGTMILMVAHGLTSSMLFCLANMIYERTNTRTIFAMRGLQKYMPLMTTMWLIASLTNLALPPTLNLVGEIMIMSALYNWAQPTIIASATGAMITATYSLYMFLITQQSTSPKDMLIYPPHSREYLILLMHILPILLLSTNPGLIL